MVSEDVKYRYFDARQERACEYWDLYMEYLSTGKALPYQYRRLNYTYLMNVAIASARNRLTDKLLKHMERVLMNGVLHLDICSSFAGRSQLGVADTWDVYIEYGEFNPEDDRFSDWLDEFTFTPGCEDTAYSDYGTKPSVNLMLMAMDAKTPEEKYMYLDQIIHQSHQNGDLSQLYVEGGYKTLDRLDNAFRFSHC